MAELKWSCYFETLKFCYFAGMGSYHQFLVCVIHKMSSVLLPIQQLSKLMNVKNKPLSPTPSYQHMVQLFSYLMRKRERDFFFPTKKKKENEFVKIIIYM